MEPHLQAKGLCQPAGMLPVLGRGLDVLEANTGPPVFMASFMPDGPEAVKHPTEGFEASFNPGSVQGR